MPESVSYHWLVNGSEVATTSDPTFMPDPVEIGAVLTVKVEGSTAGIPSVTSAASIGRTILAGSFALTSKPSLSGSFRVGSVVSVTANLGSWFPVPESAIYHWSVDGNEVATTSEAVFIPSSSEIGGVLTVKVTGASTGYSSATSIASIGSTIRAGAFALTTKPILTGSYEVGYPMSVDLGTWAWSPVAASAIYHWRVNGIEVAQTADPVYTPTADEIGGVLTVVAEGFGDGFSASSAASVGRTIRQGAFTTSVKPVLNGSFRIGSNVTVATGSWVPAATSYTYLFKLDGIAAQSGTQATYALQPGDLGKVLTVTLTGHTAGLLDMTATTSVGRTVLSAA